jgi:serine phosphatase RsbU (regulator of sigma subunit)
MNGTLRAGAVRLRDGLATSMVPLAMLIAVSVLDLATGRDTVFFPFLILCPALAAVSGSPRSVLVFGVLVLPLRYALADYDNQVASVGAEYFQTNTGVFIAATVICAWVAVLRIRRERMLAAVTSVALAAQEALLPPLPERVGNLRVGMRYFGAAAEARIGGDLYAAVETPYGTRVLIGDVSGNGLGAVRTAAVVLGGYREAAQDEPDLVGVARRVEASLRRSTPGEKFTTAVFVEVREHDLALLHRGHVSPIRVTAEGVMELDAPEPGLPLGLGELAQTGTEHPACWTVPFAPGDVLVLMTDGVTEARDAHGEFYPLAERVHQLLAPWPQGDQRTERDLDAAAERIGRDLLRHVGGDRLDDDAVVLLITRDDGDAA